MTEEVIGQKKDKPVNWVASMLGKWEPYFILSNVFKSFYLIY